MNAISGNIDQLATALAKAQGEITAAKLDGANPHFKSKYGTLASFWESIRSPLSKNGLAVSQVMDAEHGEMVTILMHASGQFITSTYAIRPQQDTPQGWGSAITYARRYCLAAIVGAVADDDDDGNAASQRKVQVDPATGEVKDVPPPAYSAGNGKKPATPVGPRTPEALRAYLQSKAAASEKEAPLSKGWDGAIVGHLDKITGDQHRLFLMYAFSLPTGSSSELSTGQWHALKNWLALAKGEDEKWYPDQMSVNECKAVMAFMAPVEQESMLEEAAAANDHSTWGAQAL